MKTTSLIATACSLAAASASLAQNTIDSTRKMSWCENSGWMNWRDADGGAAGVRDNGTFFSGSIWCENVGWITMGDGVPAAGVLYSNSTGADYGVNISSTGTLSGYAWSENAGWINFGGGALAVPAQPARIDFAAGRIRGYAWSENLGWINLDDATSYVQLACYANCDSSTAPPILNVNDFQCFLNRFAADDPSANCDRSTAPPTLNVNDFQCFLNKFSAGCP